MTTLPYDEIHVEDLEVFARHGVFPEENRLGQKFVISLVLYVDTRPAGIADCLEKSVHYGEVSAFLTDYMHEHTFQLIETAAEHMAEEVLLHYPLVKGLTLELKKPWAPVGLPVKTVSVKITRFWHTAYIALGSNLGDKKAYLDDAVRALDALHGCKVEKVSSYLKTAPYGGVERTIFSTPAWSSRPSCRRTSCSIVCMTSSRRRTASASSTGGRGRWILISYCTMTL